MTSDTNNDETVNYFKQNKFFGLRETNVRFFKQNSLPAIDDKGKIILKSSKEVFLAPNGNGGIYTTLSDQGIIKDLINDGIKYIHILGVDNIL